MSIRNAFFALAALAATLVNFSFAAVGPAMAAIEVSQAAV